MRVELCGWWARSGRRRPRAEQRLQPTLRGSSGTAPWGRPGPAQPCGGLEDPDPATSSSADAAFPEDLRSSAPAPPGGTGPGSCPGPGVEAGRAGVPRLPRHCGDCGAAPRPAEVCQLPPQWECRGGRGPPAGGAERCLQTRPQKRGRREGPTAAPPPVLSAARQRRSAGSRCGSRRLRAARGCAHRPADPPPSVTSPPSPPASHYAAWGTAHPRTHLPCGRPCAVLRGLGRRTQRPVPRRAVLR